MGEEKTGRVETPQMVDGFPDDPAYPIAGLPSRSVSDFDDRQPAQTERGRLAHRYRPLFRRTLGISDGA
jgi:hypothetical protein